MENNISKHGMNMETKVGVNGKKYLFFKEPGGIIHAFVETQLNNAIAQCMKSGPSKKNDVDHSRLVRSKEKRDVAPKTGSLKQFKSISMKNGKKYGGTFEALNEADARKKLHTQGFEIITLQEVNEKKGKTTIAGAKAVSEVKKITLTATKFSESIIKKAWERAGKRCECKKTIHQHIGRCIGILTWENQKKKFEKNAWKACKSNGSGEYTLANCRILCRKCSEE